MAKKRKLQQGDLITSLDQLARCDWVIIRDKPYCRGWVMSWNVRTAKGYIDSGRAYEGIRLTNGQYYPSITRDEAAARFANELHRLSPCRRGEDCPMAGECNDYHCWQAYKAWLEAPVS